MKVQLKEEDTLELELDNIGDIRTKILNNASECDTGNKEEKFYIVYFSELEHDFPNYSYSELEDMLDDVLGSGNWGDSDFYYPCDSCYKAIYLDDVYEHDYYSNEHYGGIVCGDCVRNDKDEAEAYLEDITNNPDRCNELLEDSQLLDLGWEEIDDEEYEYGYNNTTRKPEDVLKNLLEQDSDGKFIFSETGYSNYSTRYGIYKKVM